MKLKIKKLNENAVIPERATEYSAGADLFACIENPITIKKGETVKIPTGISAESEDKNIMLAVFARSGLASKFGISLANGVGIIDSDYRGEIAVPLINLGSLDFIVEKNMRIAQLVAIPVIFPEIVQTDSLSDTQRGSDGFGSTGI
ncbi:MAG: dUTP diphosphatase [Oscillospiraceae bacterium]|nr:dUTP diphosphatase [Oscillospiraceae bacterium]